MGRVKQRRGCLLFDVHYIIAEDMKKGDVLTEKHLRMVRPGLGLQPKYYDNFLSRKVDKNIKKKTTVD